MKLKQRSDDFRVRELLGADVLAPRGEFRVYRVIKSKLTSFEAARALALEAGANAGDVSMCGLKDRQGVTLQHMAVRHGPAVSLRTPELRIETAGFASEPLESKASEGNAFEIVLRGLQKEDVDVLRANAPVLRERGLINYFDDQRFGNLRHGQGWIALELVRGQHEAALRALLTARSPHDDTKARAFKRALDSYWGDWTSCRDIAGKFGEHHSLFEHLKHSPQDFAGAFYHLATRLRLIHLYAYQSHLWNRAVADWVRARVEPTKRVVLKCAEGPLVYPEIDVELAATPEATFRLPGPRLADVKDKEQFELLADVLAHDQLVPAQFVIEGVSGFQLKGEERALIVTPQHLRLRPARADSLNFGTLEVEVRFELPRGAYATLVVRRLLETSAKRSEVVTPRALAPRRPERREDPAGERSPRPRREDSGGRERRSGPAGERPRRDWGPSKVVRLPDREGEAPPGRERRDAPPPRGSTRGPGGPRREFDRAPRREGGAPYRRDGDRPPRRDSGAPPRREGGASPRREGGAPYRRDGDRPQQRERTDRPPFRGGATPRGRDDVRPQRGAARPADDAPRRPAQRGPREWTERPPRREGERNLPLKDWKPKSGPRPDGERGR